jgi:WD40 repeat protein
MADARRRAEQEAQRARREARISRRLRAALAGLAVVLLLALVASGLALDLRGRAERQALVADSRRLSAQALLQPDLGRSLLLAEQAVRLDDSVDTRSALLTSLLRSPRAVGRFRAGDNQLWSLALSPDGRTLAAVDNVSLTYWWDTRTGHRLAGPLGEPRPFSGGVAAFSPDGHLLATGGAGNGVVAPPEGLTVWDVARRTVVRRLLLPTEDDAVTDAAFSPDGHLLVAGTLAGDLVFWNPASGERLGPILHPYHPPRPGSWLSLAFAPGRATLVTSAPDDKTIVWNLARRRPVRTIPLGAIALALSPDARTAALGQEDGSIILVDTATGRRRRVIPGHGPAVPPPLAFSPDGTKLASVSDDHTVVVWNVATGQPQYTLQGHAGRVTGVVFSPHGDLLYTGSESDGVIAWDLNGTRGLVRQLTTAAGPVAGIAFSPRDPNLLALAQPNGPVTLWDVTSRTQIGKPLAVTGGDRNPVAFSADGRILAAANHADGSIVLFDVRTHSRVGRPLPSLYPIYSPPIIGIAFSRDGRLLASVDEDGAIVLWDLAKQAPIGHPRDLQNGYGLSVSVAFSPDSRTLASGFDNGTVFLTRVPDGTVLHQLKATAGSPSDLPSALAFSPDGNTLATAGTNGKVRLWNPHTGAARGPGWTAGGGAVLSASFSPDGSVLATSGSDGTATLWDISSGKQIGAPLTGSSGPALAAFDPTGHILATAGGDGPVLLWNVDPASWRAQARAVAGRRLTPQEWQEFLPHQPYQPSCGAR